MKKDLFIDNNIAKNFANPQDPAYKALTQWLMAYDSKDEANKGTYAHLAVSSKLLAEYARSSAHARSASAIPVIIAKMQREGRLNRMSNEAIKAFKKAHFSKSIEKKLQSNAADHDHIPVVFLSDRRYALTLDQGLAHDLAHFPGHQARVAQRPEDLPYR